MSDDPLVTIAEAAKRLNLDRTQVRRCLGRLGTRDRTPPGQRPVMVRASAVEALRHAQAPHGTRDGTGVSVPVPDVPSDPRVAALEAEAERMRGELARAWRIADEALRGQAEMRVLMERITRALPAQEPEPAPPAARWWARWRKRS